MVKKYKTRIMTARDGAIREAIELEAYLARSGGFVELPREATIDKRKQNNWDEIIPVGELTDR